jgi:hypothetical protein
MFDQYKQNVIDLFALVDKKQGNSDVADLLRNDIKKNFDALSYKEKTELSSFIGSIYKNKAAKGTYV